jgi:glucose/arabinose dehydrogenase
MKPANYCLPGKLPVWLRSGTLLLIIFSLLVLEQSCKKDFSTPANADENLLKSGKDKKRELDLKLVAEGLAAPLGVADPDDESKRLFIFDQVGKVWIIDKNGNLLPDPFLDISSKMIPLNLNSDERGLIGFAFHPKFKHNGKFYVYYQAPRRDGGPAPGVLWNNLSRVAEYKVSASNPNKADINSERAVLEIDDPQGNHNGGTIAFGPEDGYLYIAIGDGGGANDVNVGHVPDWYLVNAGGNGQDIEANLFGNILRIDVDAGIPYGIPASNPFVGKAGLDEIYAYGLRNPYRFSFDSKGDHDLIVGDVGQLLFEEINVIKKGGNYGWNVKEGMTCFNAASSLLPLGNCPGVDNFGNPLIDPVIVINNTRNPSGGRAIAIIGGNVYRGNRLHDLRGKYIFGTYSQSGLTRNGELFAATMNNHGAWAYEEVVLKSFPNDLGMLLKGFGEDRKGEIYLTTSGIFGPTGNTGKVYKLVELDKEDDDEEED